MATIDDTASLVVGSLSRRWLCRIDGSTALEGRCSKEGSFARNTKPPGESTTMSSGESVPWGENGGRATKSGGEKNRGTKARKEQSGEEPRKRKRECEKPAFRHLLTAYVYQEQRMVKLSLLENGTATPR